MINLLPPDYAMRIRFGRSNTVLRRWILGAIVAIAGLLVIMSGGWLYLNQQSHDLNRSLKATNTELQAQNIDKVKKDAAEISGDIKAINLILGNEILFSKLMQDIGHIMPPNTVLSSLSLGNVSGAIDLTANSVDQASAAQIAINLNDPANGLFTRVDIITITCTNDQKNYYKCAATYKALFNKTAQSKYLNVAKGGQ